MPTGKRAERPRAPISERPVDDGGAVIERFRVSHLGADLAAMCRRLCRARVRRVAIERPAGPVVDAPDADVLADVRRSDGGRLRALAPDSPATLTLRAHLAIVLPGAVGLFADIDSPISLRLLARFPSAASADWLSERRLGSGLRADGHCGGRSAGELYRRLVDAPAGLLGEEGRTRGAVSEALVGALVGVREQIAVLEARIAEALALHPDGQIFTSLPRSGTVRAANLLAEIGDRRERFPTPDSLACLAGAAPSTRSSATHRAVSFRWAADKKLRDALIDFAGDSRHANPWAADLSAKARARGTTNPDAERILARSSCGVIWRCRQDRVPYDPERHNALQRLLAVEG
jgi:transposase